MKHLTAIGILVMAALLMGGGQGLYTALTNMEPAAMTCADLAKASPKRDWLRLTDCEIDLEHAGYEGVKDPSTLYLPLRPPGAADSDPARVVLETSDAEMISIVRHLGDVGEVNHLLPGGTKEAAINALRSKRSFDGLILFGIELTDSKRTSVKQVVENVIEDFVIMKHGEAPKPLFAGLMFTGGLALLGLFIYRFKKKDKVPAPSAPK